MPKIGRREGKNGTPQYLPRFAWRIRGREIHSLSSKARMGGRMTHKRWCVCARVCVRQCVMLRRRPSQWGNFRFGQKKCYKNNSPAYSLHPPKKKLILEILRLITSPPTINGGHLSNRSGSSRCERTILASCSLDSDPTILRKGLFFCVFHVH